MTLVAFIKFICLFLKNGVVFHLFWFYGYDETAVQKPFKYQYHNKLLHLYNVCRWLSAQDNA